MKTTRNFRFLASIIIFVIIALLSACFNRRPTINSTNPAFAKYISGFTSGMVSRKSSIRIELVHGVNEPDTAGHTGQTYLDSAAAYNASLTHPLPDSSLLEDAFSFEPEIKGHAIWITDRIIEFIPSELLPPNQLYTAEFILKNVAVVDNDLEKFNFQLSTYPQNLFVAVDGLRNYDDYNIEWEKLTGKISTSDYEDTTAIKKVLTVTQNGKSLFVKITPSYRNNEFYFYVDSIKRTEKPGKLLVTWNGEAIKSITTGNQEITIPALGDFTVIDAKVIDDGDQYVELTFSDPILYNQNLKGIINIQGMENLTYTVENNHVKVFLQNRIEGDKLLSVTNGIKNFRGYKMSAAYSISLHFDEPNPLVRINGNGCILPNSNGLIFPFEAISLKAVDVRVVKIFENNVHQFLQVNNLDGNGGLMRVGKVIVEKRIALDYDKKKNLKQWNTFVVDLKKLISPDPGAIYKVSIKFNKAYAICNCDDAENEASENGATFVEQDDNWDERYWYGGSFDDGYDYWDDYYEGYSPCQNYYYYGKAVSRSILASDIGLIYKLDDNKMSHAFVTNMITARPMPGATIEYYDYTRQLIASGVAGADGMLDLQLKRKPFLMLAKSGKQRGYLKLLDGSANSLSKFDIEGEVVQKGIKGFIYGERGVWRPGDSLYLNFIMEDKEKRLPPNHPVKFELRDPNGQIVSQVTKTKNTNGLYDFRTATTAEAPTGNYTATAKVGNRTFMEYLKIETVKPNRLKIYMDFDKGKINDTTAKLTVKWLHGAIAKNLHAVVNVSVNESQTSFAKYRSYEFDSPIRKYSANTEAVFDGNLDEKGEAQLKTNIDVGQTAPGMLRATYISKVFEEGGDFSIDRYSIPYSPYKTYVGLAAPETKSYAMETGNKYKFDVVTLDEKGLLINTSKLQVKIYKIQWRWWYERGDENFANYISRSSTVVVKDTMINAKDGKGGFKFGINYPEYGRYLITVTDPVGGHQTGKIVYIDWPYWSRENRSNNENANMLNFACDKEKYTTGENIKLSFPSSAAGTALVSIETGAKVVKKFWIQTKKGETVYEFPASGNMAPNAFVHVTLREVLLIDFNKCNRIFF